MHNPHPTCPGTSRSARRGIARGGFLLYLAAVLGCSSLLFAGRGTAPGSGCGGAGGCLAGPNARLLPCSAYASLGCPRIADQLELDDEQRLRIRAILLDADMMPIGMIGALLSGWTTGEGNVTIRRVLSGMPAQRAGIESGDVITRVDGQRITGLTVGQVVRIVRGTPHHTVRLTIQRPGEESEREFVMERQAVADACFYGPDAEQEAAMAAIDELLTPAQREQLERLSGAGSYSWMN